MSQQSRRKARRQFYRNLSVRTDRKARRSERLEKQEVRLASAQWDGLKRDAATISPRYQGAR
jgi:hypothetical protein